MGTAEPLRLVHDAEPKAVEQESEVFLTRRGRFVEAQKEVKGKSLTELTEFVGYKILKANTTTGDAIDAGIIAGLFFLEAMERLGGGERFEEWIQENLFSRDQVWMYMQSAYEFPNGVNTFHKFLIVPDCKCAPPDGGPRKLTT